MNNQSPFVSDLWTNLRRSRLSRYMRERWLTISDRNKPQALVTQFKTNWWQTEHGASVFMKGSDRESSPSAAIMDEVINSIFLDHCSPGDKVLDLGSGHGIVSLFLARNGLAVTACDVSAPLLDVLRQNSGGLQIEIRQGDAHTIPAANDEFDVVVARMFLGHFPDWPDIVGEMARCCRPGGKLMMDFTSKENADFGKRYGGRACSFASSPDLRRLQFDPSGYFAEVSLSEISDVCRKLGLKVVERIPCTFFLHNRLIGHSLGTEQYITYQTKAKEFLEHAVVREFVVWFEQEALRYLPVWMSYYNVLILEKL